MTLNKTVIQPRHGTVAYNYYLRKISGPNLDVAPIKVMLLSFLLAFLLDVGEIPMCFDLIVMSGNGSIEINYPNIVPSVLMEKEQGKIKCDPKSGSELYYIQALNYSDASFFLRKFSLESISSCKIILLLNIPLLDSGKEVLTPDIVLRHLPELTNFPIDSHVYLELQLESIPNRVYEVYHLNSELFFNEIVYHSSAVGDTITKRRRDFKGTQITMGHAKSFTLISNSGWETAQNPQRKTSTYQFLAFMQDFLNFKAIVLPLGDFRNMTKALHGNKIDFGLSATGMIPSVAKHFRFLSIPTYKDFMRAYYSPPEPTKSWTLHFKVFSIDAWLIIFLMLVILFLCHVLISKELNLKDTSWWIISCMTLKGFQTRGKPEKISLQIIRYIGSIMCCTLYGIYSGGFICSLSLFKEPPVTISKFIELGYTFGIKNDTYLLAAFQAGDYSSDSTAAKMFSHLHKSMGMPDMESAIEHTLQNPKYVFLSEVDIHEFVSREGIGDESLCRNFRELAIVEYTVQQSCILKKTSPMANFFNYARVSMTEVGIWNMFNRRREVYQASLEPNCADRDEKKHPFNFKEVLIPFIVLTCGISSCVLIFLYEKKLLRLSVLTNNK